MAEEFDKAKERFVSTTGGTSVIGRMSPDELTEIAQNPSNIL